MQVKFQGKHYSAATPEDLVVLKIHAYRVRDLDDVAAVLESQFSELGWNYIHQWTTGPKCESS
jgi:hypothetical protein